MINILDKDGENTLGTLNNMGQACPYYNDLYEVNLEFGTGMYKFEAPFGYEASRHLMNGNTIVRKGLDGEFLNFTITHVSEVNAVTKRITVTAMSVGLDLSHEVAEPLTGDNWTASTYLAKTLEGTGWTVGRVESTEAYSLEFKDYIKTLNRIKDIADAFALEIEYTVDYTGSYVGERFVNLVKSRGEAKGKRFTYGKDLLESTRNVFLGEEGEYNGLATAVTVIGKSDATGVPATLKDVVLSKVNGDLVDKPAGQSYIEDKEATERWGKKGRPIKAILNVDSNDPQYMERMAFEFLQRNKNPKYTYTFKVLMLENYDGGAEERVRLGDVVQVLDVTFEPALSLFQRAVAMKISFTDPTKDEVILGFYKVNRNTSFKKINEIVKKIQEKEAKWDSGGTAPSREEVVEIINGTSVIIPGSKISEGLYDYPLEEATQADNILKDWRNKSLQTFSGEYGKQSPTAIPIGWRYEMIGDVEKQVLSIEGDSATGYHATVKTGFQNTPGTRFCIGSFLLFRFKARSPVPNTHLTMALSGSSSSSSSIPFKANDGTSSNLAFMNLVTYDDRESLESFSSSILTNEWQEFSLVISPQYAKYERGFADFTGENQYNAFHFMNTNHQDKRNELYGTSSILPFDNNKDAQNQAYVDYFFIQIGHNQKQQTPLSGEDYSGTPYVIQVADLEMYEMNPEIIRQAVTYDPDQNIYIQVRGDELRIVEAGSLATDSLTYKPVVAASFVNRSTRESKDNIQLIDGDFDASKLVESLNFHRYHLKTNLQRGVYDKEKMGLILDDVLTTLDALNLKPSTLIDSEGVDLYSFVTILGVALKQQIELMKQTRLDIHELYESVSELHQRIDTLEKGA